LAIGLPPCLSAACNEGASALRAAPPVAVILFSTTNHKEVEPMSIVGTKLKPFQATAYLQGKFVDVSDADVLGKWGVFFFLPGRLHLRVPDRAGRPCRQLSEELKGLGVEVYSVSTDPLQPQGLARQLAGHRQDQLLHAG
jgi:hypothetical protein